MAMPRLIACQSVLILAGLVLATGCRDSNAPGTGAQSLTNHPRAQVVAASIRTGNLEPAARREPLVIPAHHQSRTLLPLLPRPSSTRPWPRMR